MNSLLYEYALQVQRDELDTSHSARETQHDKARYHRRQLRMWSAWRLRQARGPRDGPLRA